MIGHRLAVGQKRYTKAGTIRLELILNLYLENDLLNSVVLKLLKNLTGPISLLLYRYYQRKGATEVVNHILMLPNIDKREETKMLKFPLNEKIVMF